MRVMESRYAPVPDVSCAGFDDFFDAMTIFECCRDDMSHLKSTGVLKWIPADTPIDGMGTCSSSDNDLGICNRVSFAA